MTQTRNMAKSGEKVFGLHSYRGGEADMYLINTGLAGLAARSTKIYSINADFSFNITILSKISNFFQSLLSFTNIQYL